jgi:hypothetical protein
MHSIRRLALLLPIAFVAACGDDPSAPVVTTRAFALSHIAGLAPDSGYVCPPRYEGAIARIIAAGEGIELSSDGDLRVDVYVGTYERWPSTTQVANGVGLTGDGTFTRSGETLTFAGLDWSPLTIVPTATLAGDSLSLRVHAECPTDTTIPGELTLVYKETLP